MKSHALQLLVVVVLAMTSSVFDRVVGRATSGVSVTAHTDNEVDVGGGRECPYKPVPGTFNTVTSVMLNGVFHCHKMSATFKQQLGRAGDTAAYRRLFRSGCVQEPTVRACIASIATDVDVCLAENEQRLWEVVLDFVDVSIKATCDDGGETIAAIFGDELKPMTTENRLRALSCMRAMTVQTLLNKEADLPGYTLRKYRAIKDGKQCVLNVAKRGQTSTNNFEHFVDRLTNNMKCLSHTYEIVSCSSLEAADPRD